MKKSKKIKEVISNPANQNYENPSKGKEDHIIPTPTEENSILTDYLLVDEKNNKKKYYCYFHKKQIVKVYNENDIFSAIINKNTKIVYEINKFVEYDAKQYLCVCIVHKQKGGNYYLCLIDNINHKILEVCPEKCKPIEKEVTKEDYFLSQFYTAKYYSKKHQKSFKTQINASSSPNKETTEKKFEKNLKKLEKKIQEVENNQKTDSNDLEFTIKKNKKRVKEIEKKVDSFFERVTIAKSDFHESKHKKKNKK